MRNGSHAIILCENGYGQRAARPLKWWPNTKFRSLMSTTGRFEASNLPELANRRSVAFHQDNARPHTSVVTHQKLWEFDKLISRDRKGSEHPFFRGSLTENSLAVLNHKLLEANSQIQNVKLGGHQTSISINRLWHKLCDMLRHLVGTPAPGHHDCSIQE
ncbi:uncharacterized protein TNCV_3511541 [Trichonephila clavipes]|nr:uncharacterized protein TNCV_3511541 [Trichonephila clavipes]